MTTGARTTGAESVAEVAFEHAGDGLGLGTLAVGTAFLRAGSCRRIGPGDSGRRGAQAVGRPTPVLISERMDRPSRAMRWLDSLS